MAERTKKTGNRRGPGRAKRIAKSIRYFIGRRIVKLVFCLPDVMRLSRALSFSKFIATLGYYLPGEHRRQAFTNLRVFFGKEKSHAELKNMARNIGITATKGAIESVYAVSPRKEELYSSMTIEGKEHLDQALSRGKGVIALSAHLGNFAVMGGKLIAEGYPFHLVLKLPKDPVLSQYFTMKMEQYGLKFIEFKSLSASQKEIVRRLRQNQIVCLIADGDQKAGGIPVDLMGQEVAIPAGPAILATRTGAAILPMFIIRQADDSHKIIIDPPVEISEAESQDRTVALLTVKLVRIIESYIRQYPTQWHWVNKKHHHSHHRKWFRKLDDGELEA